MSAATIAQYYVETDHVRVELEIGAPDLPAFRDLLPASVHQAMGFPAEPAAERKARFFREGLAILADGELLAGELLRLQPAKRVKRDEISGEALPPTGDEPDILAATLAYPLAHRPRELTLQGLRSTSPVSVGFVVYHLGVAVNDFRYLTPSQTVELDWEDAWYSHFPSRQLQRRYSDPMSGFLYVEPYEVRKEIIARPKDLQRWVDLGLAGLDTIPAALYPEVKRRAAEFLRAHQVVEIDGLRLEPELSQVNFLERTLRRSRVIDPPVDLPIDLAILGVIFSYPTDGMPQRVTMEWDLWDERIQRVPAAAVDAAGALPGFLEPDWRILEWQNFLRIPVLPEMVVVARPPTALERMARMLTWPLAGGLLLALATALWRQRSRRSPRPALAVAGLFVLTGAASLWLGRGAALSDERIRAVVSGLLHNVYRAFDYRGEERIYDELARSVHGDLLERLYLETRRGLTLAEQGGARVKVKEVELLELEATTLEAGAFRAAAAWRAAGDVGHWGHVHRRENLYRARVRAAPIGGVWKLVDVEILEERRL